MMPHFFNIIKLHFNNIEVKKINKIKNNFNFIEVCLDSLIISGRVRER